MIAVITNQERNMLEKVTPLTARQFELYVAELVQTLEFARDGIIYKNKVYSGVRQPGSYEIDVALEVQLAPPLKFTLIVECKNWKRPVDRPVVQKLAQTRDAIGADKAAIASPIGFTKEADEVARTLGIALWVVTLQEWIIIYPNFSYPGLSLDALRADRFRDWAKNTAKIGLASWSTWDLELFPTKAKLPTHLQWARFLAPRYDDGREEILRAMVEKLLGVDVSQWRFSPRDMSGTTGSRYDGLRLRGW
jgi:hypothetical protein